MVCLPEQLQQYKDMKTNKNSKTEQLQKDINEFARYSVIAKAGKTTVFVKIDLSRWSVLYNNRLHISPGDITGSFEFISSLKDVDRFEVFEMFYSCLFQLGIKNIRENTLRQAVNQETGKKVHNAVMNLSMTAYKDYHIDIEGRTMIQISKDFKTYFIHSGTGSIKGDFEPLKIIDDIIENKTINQAEATKATMRLLSKLGLIRK